MNIKILKPAMSGTTVRDPRTREQLPVEGKAVRMNTFWNRRIADGSVVEVPLTKESVDISRVEAPIEKPIDINEE